jgi:hypothetical protein
VFEINADEVFAVADIFKKHSINNVTGSTQTGISLVQLDVSLSGVDGTYVVQAIDISQDPNNNDVTTSNANIMVRINNHFYRQGGTGL